MYVYPADAAVRRDKRFSSAILLSQDSFFLLMQRGSAVSANAASDNRWVVCFTSLVCLVFVLGLLSPRLMLVFVVKYCCVLCVLAHTYQVYTRSY